MIYIYYTKGHLPHDIPWAPEQFLGQVKKNPKTLFWPAAAAICSPRHRARFFFGQYFIPDQAELVAEAEAGIWSPGKGPPGLQARVAEEPVHPAEHQENWHWVSSAGQRNLALLGTAAHEEHALHTPSLVLTPQQPPWWLQQQPCPSHGSSYLPRGAWNRGGGNWLGLLSCLLFLCHFFLFWLLKEKTSLRIRQWQLANYLLHGNQLVLLKPCWQAAHNDTSSMPRTEALELQQQLLLQNLNSKTSKH